MKMTQMKMNRTQMKTWRARSMRKGILSYHLLSC